MGSFLSEWGVSIWRMLSSSAFLFLAGLTLAGLMSLLLNSDVIARLARGSRLRTVAKAAFLGVPLPLCSCSVLPVASQLRRSGLSRGGVAAFLVSTPESGIDSIFLTYSLTDPLLTVARPVAAFLTAFAAGGIQKQDNPQPIPTGESTADRKCGCATETQTLPGRSNWPRRLLGGIRYAYTDLIGDLAPYLLTGFLLAGLLEASFGLFMADLPAYWKTGWIGYMGAIMVGLPLYICATSSTPLAAVLISYGFSPGAVLVFLLVGPATNVATLVVVRQILGTNATVRYLLAIVAVAVICGVLTDQAYDLFHIRAAYRTSLLRDATDAFSAVCAALLAVLIVYWSCVKAARKIRTFFA